MLSLILFMLLAYSNYVDGGHDIIVVDDLLNINDIQGILTKLNGDNGEVIWSFHNLASLSSEIHKDSEANNDAFPASHYWTTRLIPSELFLKGDLKTVWHKLSQQVAVQFGVKPDELQIIRTVAQISSRGDNVLPTNYPCSAKQDGLNLIIVVIMVPKWGKNSYGEIVVYDERGEILKSIHPLNGRVVVLPCGHNFVLKPPSIDCKDRLRTLMIHASTSSATPSQLTSKDHKAYMQEKFALHSLQTLPALSPSYSKFNVGKYITRQFKTPKGHPIIAFDGVIPSEIIDALANTMINGIYVDNPPEPNSSDNVQWILDFELEAVLDSSLWSYVQAIVKYASRKEGYYPYDVSCNSIRSHDTTRIHIDCAPDQDEYTLLIYLNRNWTANDQGETLFLDYERKEMIYAIRPKYGRVVIFQGTIPHSARPPSPTIHGPRFTFAIKFAASKEEALGKTMNIDADPLHLYISKVGPEEAAKTLEVLKDLMAGKKSQFETEAIIQEYERKLKEL